LGSVFYYLLSSSADFHMKTHNQTKEIIKISNSNTGVGIGGCIDLYLYWTV